LLPPIIGLDIRMTIGKIIGYSVDLSPTNF
jgi:hypothetical protein